MRVTIVASQGEADVICSMLRAEGIECNERSAVGADETGTWREVLVEESDLVLRKSFLPALDDEGRPTRRDREWFTLHFFEVSAVR